MAVQSRVRSAGSSLSGWPVQRLRGVRRVRVSTIRGGPGNLTRIPGTQGIPHTLAGMGVAMRSLLVQAAVVGLIVLGGFETGLVLGGPQAAIPQYTPGLPPYENLFGPGTPNTRPLPTQPCVSGNYQCAIASPIGTLCQYCSAPVMQFTCTPTDLTFCCGKLMSNTPLCDCGTIVTSACNVNGMCPALAVPPPNPVHCKRAFAAVVPCP